MFAKQNHLANFVAQFLLRSFMVRFAMYVISFCEFRELLLFVFGVPIHYVLSTTMDLKEGSGGIQVRWSFYFVQFGSHVFHLFNYILNSSILLIQLWYWFKYILKFNFNIRSTNLGITHILLIYSSYSMCRVLSSSCPAPVVHFIVITRTISVICSCDYWCSVYS